MKKDKTEIVTVKESMPVVEYQGEAERLISQAIDKNIDVDKLERLLAMRSDMKKEWAKGEYDKAMAAFQGECPIIERTKQGYNYKYAPLEVIAEQIKPFLLKNGLSYTFNTEEIDNKIIVYCIVTHVAGHTGEPSKAVITKETTTKMNLSQQSGAVMTYGKRYSLMNALAIMVRDEDTDASTSKEVSVPQYAQKQTYIQPKVTEVYVNTPIAMNHVFITSTQNVEIRRLIALKGKTDEERDGYLKMAFNKEFIKDLTTIEADQMIKKLKSLPDKSTKINDTEEQIDIDSVAKAIDAEKPPVKM